MSRINAVPRGHAPAPGEVLVVYVDPGRTKGTIRAPAPRGFEAHEEGPGATRAPSTADTARVPGRDEPPDPPPDEPPPREEDEGRDPSTADTARVPGH